MTLVVYADTLTAVTFLFCLSGLILFGLIFNYKLYFPRIIVSSMISALLSAYIFIQFLRSHVPVYLYFPFLILLIAVALGIAYDFENKRSFVKGILSQFVINLAQTGVAIILLSVIAYRWHNWIFIYIFSVALTESVVIVVLFRQSRYIGLQKRTVQIEIRGESREKIRALVDTGNILRDPVYNRAVILISPEYKKTVSVNIVEPFEMECFTVNGESMLEGGIVSEAVIICKNKENLLYNVPVAFGAAGFVQNGFAAIIPVEYARGMF